MQMCGLFCRDTLHCPLPYIQDTNFSDAGFTEELYFLKDRT